MMKGILLYCSMNAFFTGQIIEEARKKANMTQAKLAEKIGTNKSYISRVETGKTEQESVTEKDINMNEKESFNAESNIKNVIHTGHLSAWRWLSVLS